MKSSCGRDEVGERCKDLLIVDQFGRATGPREIMLGKAGDDFQSVVGKIGTVKNKVMRVLY